MPSSRISRKSSKQRFSLPFENILSIHWLDRLSTSFPRIGRLEDDIELLKRPAFRFDVEEVYEHEFEQVPKHEEDVEPVPNLHQNVSAASTLRI